MLNANNINKQTIYSNWLTDANISLDVLRLDKLHPVVSGNKWFKLKYYLQEARVQKLPVATFGGAWSNHIVATAFLCKAAALESIGFIRGERPEVLSKTLAAAQGYGMKLHFIERSLYQNKELVKQQYAAEKLYWINEGGYGTAGAKGASEILHNIDMSTYTHIIAAVGTGTTLAGLLMGALPGQKVLGISSMKGNYALRNAILQISGTLKTGVSLEINNNYHFGGYGKHPLTLITFINETYVLHKLPLDIIYTGKTFYAIKDLAEKGCFEKGSNLLMIHTGGLQGNSSLPPEVLVF